MSARDTLNELQESAAAFWVARNAAERKLLAAGAALLTLGLIYAILFGPALSGRAQLEKSLPPLRQQAADMQAMAGQAATLAAVSAPAPVALTKESIEASLARKGLKPQTVALSGDLVRLQLPSVSFAGLLDWLDDMQKSAALSVLEANIAALAQVDTVSATLTLRLQKNEEKFE